MIFKSGVSYKQDDGEIYLNFPFTLFKNFYSFFSIMVHNKMSTLRLSHPYLTVFQRCDYYLLLNYAVTV